MRQGAGCRVPLARVAHRADADPGLAGAVQGEQGTVAGSGCVGLQGREQQGEGVVAHHAVLAEGGQGEQEEQGQLVRVHGTDHVKGH